MVVQHNISAMNANRYYGINNKALAGSLEKLSSGYAINRAGDNAAGLAVSEKMRAQIGGLTQASKNAEDGISMVQTFEGALQETDSILQRMRTLAVQSANGNYQDDVDRDAIQLEFDQLNDELNQIADTDFNGVVMLNGGQMADGLKAVDGKFDYANKADQLTADAKAAAQEAVDTAKTALDKAQATFDGNNYDLSESGKAAEWNTVDQNAVTKDDLDNLWVSLGITDPNDATKADTSKINEIAVTFKFDGTNWNADSGKANDGSSVTVSGMATTTASVADASGYGGFSVTVGSNDANAIFDATNAKEGDTVTLVFSNTDSATKAPDNIGFDENSVEVVNNNATGDAGSDVTVGDLSISIGSLKDTDMTEKTDAAYKALEDATISVDYSQAKASDAGTYGNVKLTLADGSEFDIGVDSTTAQEFTAADGTKFTVTASKDDGKSENTLTFASEDGKELFSITVGAAGAAVDGSEKAGKDGSISAKISLNTSAYDDAKGYGVTVGENPDLESSNANKDALDKAKADYNKAVADLNGIKDLDSAKAYMSGGKVSESDTFDQSAAKMTYTDKMSLQVGARTKDAVNFTFSYNTDDLGGLEKNLNCSARKGGLETELLSVSTQKDANDAIDKIDKALNKVNMVRATFGAVQNRLEHKINNLDTNTENITAAESRIRDTQMDKEMMKFTSSQILSQASQSMLAQANSLPQGVLQLLG